MNGFSALARGLLLGALFASAPKLDAQRAQIWLPDGTAIRSSPSDSTVLAAQRALATDSTRPEPFIALARAQAGVRQMREAVATLSAGLVRFPNHADLYRWRGHRYLSLMEFDRAMADFHRGAELDSLSYGIWYHRGVTHFARGEFDEAAFSFQRGIPLAPDTLELAGSYDWLWNSYMRAGATAEARETLRSAPQLRSATNAYVRRLALYRNRTQPVNFMTKADTAPVALATLSYGLAAWAIDNDQREVADQALRTAARPVGWPSFAYIAATADVAGFRSSNPAAPTVAQARSPALLACVASAPESQFRRELIQLGVLLPKEMPSTPETRGVRDWVAVHLRDAVESWRMDVAGTLDSLPDLDQTLGWQNVAGAFRLTVFSGGRLTLEPDALSRGSMPSDPAIALVSEFVERARQRSVGMQDSASRADTTGMSLTVYLFAPTTADTALVDPPLPPTRIPVGVLRAPLGTPVAAIPGVRGPRYPEEARSLGFEASLYTEFVVDTAGRALRETIEFLNRDNPSDPRAARALGQFVASVENALPDMRFRPATLAGCATELRVRQPFLFRLER